ncbi:MAG: histidine kinase [Lachnospiraceae bacterium]|nr:histidine kinase [Lachnospiraceae bacterium]
MNTEISMPSLVIPEIVGVLATLLVSFSVIMPGIDHRSKRYFTAFFSTIALNRIIFIIDMMTYMKPYALSYTKFFPLIEYILFFLSPLILSIYMLYYCIEDFYHSRVFKIIICLWGIFCFLHIIGHFTNLFYYTNPDGSFFRKPTHPLLFAPIIAIVIIDIIILILKRKNLTRKHFIAFLIYLIPTLFSLIIYSLIFEIISLSLTIYLGSISMYVLILCNQIEQSNHQQVALANKDVKILILQMRPHFIYNTMTSIYYLCEQNPKKAQQVILNFTTYLRKNFDAIASNETISFTEELEHVKAYLAVELAQFEDILFVKYDIENTDFKLPPLTLEPLVENSIKHGMDPDADPLQILIKTLKRNSANVILVKDNGPGFDPENILNSNNALSNIRRRLEVMCKGKITINSVKGEGTSIEITIP